MITKFTNALEYLNGIICIYKPPDVGQNYIKKIFCTKICAELNVLHPRPQRNYLEITKDENESVLSVNVRPSYANNMLIAGPGYTPDSFNLKLMSISKKTSGVCILGINRGVTILKGIYHCNVTKTVQVTGKLGEATKTLFKEDKVIAKAKYHKIKKSTLDKVLSSFEAAHQNKLYQNLGIHIQSQEAYDIAVQGLLRPNVKDIIGIYSLKCIDFKPPYFTIEVVCVNESEEYLLNLIHDLGLQLRTFAHCTGLRCIRYGPFTVDDSILIKDFTLTNVIKNMQCCKSKILDTNN